MRKILLAMAALGTLAVLSEGRIDLTATEPDAIAVREIDARVPTIYAGHAITIARDPGTTSCSEIVPGVIYECGPR